MRQKCVKSASKACPKRSPSTVRQKSVRIVPAIYISRPRSKVRQSVSIRRHPSRSGMSVKMSKRVSKFAKLTLLSKLRQNCVILLRSGFEHCDRPSTSMETEWAQQVQLHTDTRNSKDVYFTSSEIGSSSIFCLSFLGANITISVARVMLKSQSEIPTATPPLMTSSDLH